METNDWFVFKSEALEYLNRVASEIRMLASSDPLLQRIVERMAVRHVSGTLCSFTPNYEYAFYFEVDRGRFFRGYRYGIRDDGDGLMLRQMGSDNRMLIPIYFDELEGQHLLDTIREMLVQDVLKM